MMIQNSSELAAQLAARIHNPARTHNLVGPKTIRSKEGKRNEYSTNEYGSPLGSDGNNASVCKHRVSEPRLRINTNSSR